MVLKQILRNKVCDTLSDLADRIYTILTMINHVQITKLNFVHIIIIRMIIYYTYTEGHAHYKALCKGVLLQWSMDRTKDSGSRVRIQSGQYSLDIFTFVQAA